MYSGRSLLSIPNTVSLVLTGIYARAEEQRSIGPLWWRNPAVCVHPQLHISNYPVVLQCSLMPIHP